MRCHLTSKQTFLDMDQLLPNSLNLIADPWKRRLGDDIILISFHYHSLSFGRQPKRMMLMKDWKDNRFPFSFSFR